VLHLIQKSQLRGAEVFASQLSSHINNSGNTAIITTVFPGNAKLPFHGTVISLNANQNARLFDIHAWKKLARIVKDEKPDVVQANAGDTLKYAVFSKLLYRWRQPIVYRNASIISRYIKTYPKKLWNNLLFQFTQKIISVSDASAYDFSRLFPNHSHKVITIPIGIEHLQLSNCTNGITYNSVKHNGQELRIVHVGGFTFEKNHVGLLDIFELILKKNPSAVLYLIGDGPLKKKIEEISKLKNIDSKIKFLGSQANPMYYIQHSHVLILPSIIEGLPGVLLEAFYCKTPVVAYNVGGISEIVKENITGRLIPPGNNNAFANATIEATFKTAHNVSLVENAYNLVISKYLNSNIAKQFIATYETLVS
jgi:glycosyltransferase involved in cell wall biosynthesis